MILFKTGIKAEGCLAKLAAVLRATSCSVAADMTVWTTVGDWLGERPLFETKWKLRVLHSIAAS